MARPGQTSDEDCSPRRPGPPFARYSVIRTKPWCSPKSTKSFTFRVIRGRPSLRQQAAIQMSFSELHQLADRHERQHLDRAEQPGTELGRHPTPDGQ